MINKSDKLPWNFEKVVKDFLRHNTKVLVLSGNRELLYKLNHDLELVFSDYDLEKDREQFDLIISDYYKYDIEKIRVLLKMGGHFLTQQYGFENKAILQNKNNNNCFNLENEVAKFSKIGLFYVKGNQFYSDNIFDEKNNIIRRHEFYMLVKKLVYNYTLE